MDDKGTVHLHAGDCRHVLRTFPAACFDSVVTDPPYGLSAEPDIAEVMRHWIAGDPYSHNCGGFMGKGWDSFVPGPEYWREVFRVLKPGGHALVFAGTRTADLMTVALRFAGFEIRDTIHWVYASGFPKGINISKAIDRAAGAERPVIGKGNGGLHHKCNVTNLSNWDTDHEADGNPITGPATPDAVKWDGWNTSLKPAHEPIIVARKPLSEPTAAENMQRHGTGALNVNACRLATDEAGYHVDKVQKGGFGANFMDDNWKPPETVAMSGHELGRWPPNFMLSHDDACVKVPTDGGNPWECVPGCPVAALDASAGERKSGKAKPSGLKRNQPPGNVIYGGGKGLFTEPGPAGHLYGDTGGASRFFATFSGEPPFFYCAKASRAERDQNMAKCPDVAAGIGDERPSGQSMQRLDGRPARVVKNVHPTVKPLKLMAYLVRLVTQPGGSVLDPFVGSGTTALACAQHGFRCTGIDQSEEYLAIAASRLGLRVEPPTGSAAPAAA